MPEITIKTGFLDPDGREETLVEYICDHPGCPNPATRFLGVVVELRARVLVCDKHFQRADRI